MSTNASGAHAPDRWERFSWYCLLAIPAVVPVLVAKVPFVEGNPLTFSPFVMPKLFAVGVLLSLALLGWGVGFLRGRIVLRDVPGKWLALALVAAAAASTVTALDRRLAVFGGHKHYAGLFVLLLAATAFFLVTQLVTDAKRMRHLAWAVVAGGVPVAGVGLLQVLGLDPLLLSADFMTARGYSTLGNPDLTGTYLILPTVLAWTLALVDRDGRRRTIAAGAGTLTACALLLTQTRGAWLGLLLGLAFLCFLFRRSSAPLPESTKRVLYAAIALFLVVLLVSAPALAGRFRDLDDARTAGGGRLTLWSEAVSVILGNPVLGVGAGSYTYGWFAERSLDSLALAGVGVHMNDPHNAIIYTAATVGIPGAVLLMLLVGTVMYRGAGIAFRQQFSPERMLFAGWWAAVAAFAIAMLFSVSKVTALTMFSISFGVVAAACTRAVGEPRVSWGRVVASLGAIGYAAVALVISPMYLLSDASLAKAQVGDREYYSRQAISRAPWNYDARYNLAFELSKQAVLALSSGSPTAGDEFAAADEATRELVEWGPYESDSHLLRARLLTDAGQYMGAEAWRAALEACDRGLAVHPNSLRFKTRKAMALNGLGRFDEAVDLLAPVWEIDHDYTRSAAVYVEALAGAGRLTEANELLARLGRRFPGDAHIVRVEGLLQGQR